MLFRTRTQGRGAADVVVSISFSKTKPEGCDIIHLASVVIMGTERCECINVNLDLRIQG